MNVILSINPKYADLIFDGKKKYELRKTRFKKIDLKKAYVYSTNPIKKIIGEFNIEDVFYGSPEDIWDSIKNDCGLSRSEFNEYYEKSKNACVIKIKNPIKYKNPINPIEVNPKFTVPQSFCYYEGSIISE